MLYYRYYHSIMDDSSNLKYTYQGGDVPAEDSIQTMVAKLSSVLALTLYKLMNQDKSVNDEAKMPDIHLESRMVSLCHGSYNQKLSHRN